MAVKNLKVLMSGDTKPYREEVNQAVVATAKFQGAAGDSMKELAQVFGVQIGDIKDRLKTFEGGFKSLLLSMKTLGTGATSFAGAMKLLKFAIASTGIGLLIIGLASLVSYFTQTERGAEFVERAMAGLKAAFKVLIDRASAFGEGLFKIFSGKYEEGWNALKNSVKGVGDEMVEEAKAASVLEGRLQSLEDAQKQLDLVNTERRAKASELFLQAKQEETTAQNKQKLIRQAMALENAAFSDEKKLAQERLVIHKQQVSLGEARDEQNYKTLELQGSINNINRAAADTERSYTKALNAATKEVNAQNEAFSKYEANIKNSTLMKGKLTGTTVKSNVEISTTSKDGGFMDNINKSKEQTNALWRNTNDQIDKTKSNFVELGSSIQSALGDMAVGTGEFLGNLMNGEGSLQGFGMMIAGVFADMAIQVGKSAILTGTAMLGIKAALEFGNPFAAIAAGIALVAFGTALKGHLSSVASGGATGSMPAAGGGQNYNYDTRGNSAQASVQKIQVEVTGTLSASAKGLTTTLNNENTRVAIST